MAKYRIDYKAQSTIDLTNTLVDKAQGGNVRAKNDLVEMYSEYVEFMVRRYSGKTAIKDDEDLRSSIYLGFLEGIDRYDKTRNAQFIYFCHTWMKKMVFLDANKNYNLIRLPANQESFKDQFIAKYKNKEHDSIFDEDYERFRVLALTEVHLFTEFVLPESGINTLEETIDSDTEEDDLDNSEILKMNIEKLLKKFSDKERFIIEHLFGLNDKEVYSSKKIADTLDVTKVNITFTKTRIIRLLRHHIFTDILLKGI